MFKFGFSLLSCLIGGIFIAYYKRDDVEIEFHGFMFFYASLSPIIFAAGMLIDLHRFMANFGTILFRGIFITITSFILVSIGAIFCLPSLGIQSIAASDCLVIGSLFASTNFLYHFEDVNEGRENMRSLYEIAIGESIFSAATSFLLFKLVRNMDVMSLQPSALFCLVAKFGYLVVASTCFGILFAISIILAIGISFKLEEPGRCVCMEGGVRMKETRDATTVHGWLLFWSFMLYMISEFYELSNILVIFSNGVITSHYLLPKTVGYKVTVRQVAPKGVCCLEAFLYLWLGCCVVNSNHWGYVFSSCSTFGTYLAATCILFILLMVGRVPSMFHFSRHVMTKVENKEEGTTKAYLFNRWPISNVELENQVIIWWSGFMPSLIAIGLALEQFEKSGETRHAFMLTGISSVVYFSSLVYYIWMSSSLKQSLVRYMIKLTSNDLSGKKNE